MAFERNPQAAVPLQKSNKMSDPKFQIQIPVPCHENWDAMTSQEKGRFCGVCSKKVVDFSGQTKAAVLDYLQTNADQKVCGRIPANMVDPTPQIPVMPHAQQLNLSRFAFAAMLVFGSFLFGCSQPNDHTKGELAMVTPPDSLSLIDHLQQNLPLPILMGDTIIIEPEPVIMGMMIHEPIPPVPVIPEVPEEPMLLGEPAIVEPPVCVPKPTEQETEPMMMGKMIAPAVPPEKE